MRYIVAIDWAAGYKLANGFKFIELEAKNEMDGMLEAPAVACEHGRLIEYNALSDKSGKSIGEMDGMKGIWCLRILKQTKAGEKTGSAKDCAVIYWPKSHKWSKGEDFGDWLI